MPHARLQLTKPGRPKPVLPPKQADRCTVRCTARLPAHKRVCRPCKHRVGTRPLSARAMSAAWSVRRPWPGWPSALLQDLQRLALLRVAAPEPVAGLMRADKAVGVVDADSRFSTSRSSS